MIKRLMLTALLVAGFCLTASAQIVTSQLNPAMNAKSPAATGWRIASNVSIVYGTAEGDVSKEDSSGSMEKVGDVKYYGAAEGDGDSDPMPALQGVFKNEDFGLEVYMDLGNGVMKDVDATLKQTDPSTDATYTTKTDADQADKDLRVYFSWKPLEDLSIGLGYRQSVFTETLTVQTSVSSPLGTMTALDVEEKTKETETGLSIVASYRIAEMFYLAAGIENMKKEGEFERDTKTDLAGTYYPSSGSTDYVDNSWTNNYMGLGVLYGEPGDTQFRAEYSMISTPESDQDAEDGKLRNFQRKKDEIYATAEVIFSNFLLSYENRRYDYKKISEGSSDDSNKDRLDNVTLIGVGWIQPEGINLTLVTIDYKRVDEDKSSKTEFYPKGWGLYASYRF